MIITSKVLVMELVLFIFTSGQFTTQYRGIRLIDRRLRRQTPSCKDQQRKLSTNSTVPWLVLIQAKLVARILCEGALVTPQWVITVANCLAGQNDNDLKIVTYSKDERQSVQVTKFFPGYSYKAHQNDIAALKMLHPFTITNNVYPVCPQKYKDDIFCKDSCQVGSVSKAPSSVYILDLESCKQVYEKNGFPNRVSNATVCTSSADEPGDTECIGSPGSPLTCVNQKGERVLTGLLSLGWSCASAVSPALFTKVSSFYGWINSVIEDHSDDNVQDCTSQLGGNKFIKGFKEDDDGVHIDIFIPNKESRLGHLKLGPHPEDGDGGNEEDGGKDGEGEDIEDFGITDGSTDDKHETEDTEEIEGSGDPDNPHARPAKLQHTTTTTSSATSELMETQTPVLLPQVSTGIEDNGAGGGVDNGRIDSSGDTSGVSYFVLRVNSSTGEKPVYNIILKPDPQHTLEENDNFIIQLKLKRI